MKNLFWLILIWSVLSCSTTRTVISPPSESDVIESSDDEIIYSTDGETEERLLDPIEIVASKSYTLPEYNESARREFDLIHTALDLRFDWVNEHVIGRAELKLKPYFAARKFLTLDAKGFQIVGVSDQSYKNLPYEYDGQKLIIDLGKTYTRDQEVDIVINYIAKPSEGPIGGSAAITSDKGLFFINPRGEEGDKPRQIWTQGETENNSRWFPTIDKPNERMTQEIVLTVEDQMVTLSNGTLEKSVKNSDGTRTDHWRQDKGHAPYLTMIAAGDFAVAKDSWQGIELQYLVDKEYAPYAQQIFDHTPEMLQFFSDKLNYKYPWDKFSQMIAKDYVSGAMENTTAVIFGDFIQKTDRELIDNDNDYIVAHEMFHHWFGDLVTCEAWSNLTLQEGFANYGEYLWAEHHDGRDHADQHRMNELGGYLASTAQTGKHPLIHYGYGDKEEMFDGHSYNKGGLVLHMLRNHLGDDAFFTGLNRYLVDNAYSAVEVDELRMAFEDVSGEDLHWFFNQWYLSSGHPELIIDWEYNAEQKTILYSITQEQDPESNAPIFQLPITLSVFDDNGRETEFDILLNKREQSFELVYDNQPSLIIFDKNDVLLYQKTESVTDDEYMNQYKWAKAFKHRFDAINKLKNKSEASSILQSAIADPYYSIRNLAVSNLKIKDQPELMAKFRNMVVNDPHSVVRGSALSAIQKAGDDQIKDIINQVLATEKSYQVIGDAIESLARIDKAAAIEKALTMKSENAAQLVSAVAPLIAETGDIANAGYFEDKLTNVSLYSVFNFYESYFELLNAQPSSVIIEKAELLKAIATNSGNHIFYRFSATNAINNLKQTLLSTDPPSANKLKSMITHIKDMETNEMLLQRYNSY